MSTPIRRFGPPTFGHLLGAPARDIVLPQTSQIVAPSGAGGARPPRRSRFLAAASRASSAREVLDVGALTRDLFSKRLPFAEKFRPYYGRIDMGLIQEVLRMADVGIMTPRADLDRESLGLDPHALGLAQKRFGALSTLEFQVDPAAGDGLDEKLAAEIATDVRQMLGRIRGWRDSIYDIAWGLFDGRGSLEIDWHRGGGKRPYQPAGLGWIHPRRIGFGPDRELRIINTFTNGNGWWAPNGIALDDYPGKFMSWTPRYFCDYPEREGLGRRSLYWMLFKRFSSRMRMILTELFAIPWRTIEFDADTADHQTSWEDMEAAENAAEAMGGENTVAMPPGAKVNAIWPGENSGQLFELTRTGVNEELSKLWVLNTATTDAKPDALGGGAADVHKGEQNIALARDAYGIGDVFQAQLVDVYVILNYGPSYLQYAPTVRLASKDEVDRAKEQAILDGAIAKNVPVGLAAYYEKTGIPQPSAKEPVLVSVSDGMGGTSTKIIWPADWKGPRFGEAPPGAALPPSGDLGGGGQPSAGGGGGSHAAPAPSGHAGAASDAPVAEIHGYDIEEGIVARDEAREQRHLPPLPGGVGSVDALADSLTSESELAAAQAKSALTDANSANDANDAAAETSDATPSDDGKTPAPVPADDAAEAMKRVLAQRALALTHTRATVNGTEADLVQRGVREAIRQTAVWAQTLVDSIDEEGTHLHAHRALAAAADKLNLEVFARVIERTTVLSLALGALDSAWEAASDHQTRPVPFAQGRGEALVLTSPFADLELPGFSTKPFGEAISSFLGKKIVTRRVFDRLTAEAKRRAFTIAGLAKQSMLDVAHSELANGIAAGTDLRTFRASLAARFESNGWTPLNRTHVETIFRTNVNGAYASGRDVQQRQPDVLAARPYWQIQGVNDDRARAAHKAVNGHVLHHSDPFWARAPLPWGFNERCYRTTRSAADLARLGLQVTIGSAISGLPDHGFTGGGGSLFERGREREHFFELCVYLPALFEPLYEDPEGRWVRDALAAPAPGVPALAPAEPLARVYAGALVVIIDRPAGTVETGTGADGKPWTRTWPFDGGELPRTQAGDGEPIDVFCGPDAAAPLAFWLVQKDPDRELRLALGWADAAAARAAYGSVVPLEMLEKMYAQPVEHVKALLGIAPDARLLDAVRALAR